MQSSKTALYYPFESSRPRLGKRCKIVQIETTHLNKKPPTHLFDLGHCGFTLMRNLPIYFDFAFLYHLKSYQYIEFIYNKNDMSLNELSDIKHYDKIYYFDVCQNCNFAIS